MPILADCLHIYYSVQRPSGADDRAASNVRKRSPGEARSDMKTFDNPEAGNYFSVARSYAILLPNPVPTVTY
jgi:hypothetical protein